MMNVTRPRASQYWILTLLVLWLGLILAPSYLSYWTDSEMWAASATKYFFSDRVEYYFGTKPLFHFLLYLNTRLAAALNIHPMISARALMMINTAGTCIAFALLLRRNAGARAAFAGLIFLFSLSIMVKRAGQVRSDILSTHVLLWCLYFLPYAQTGWRRALPYLGFLISFLITPKSIVFIAALAPFWLPPKKKLLLYFRPAVGAGIAIILLSVLVPSLRFFWTDLGSFFVNSFISKQVGADYFSWLRFMYVTRLATENPHLFYLYFAYAPWGWYVRQQGDEFSRKMQVSGSLLTLFFLIYPDRLPFLIVALIPFWLLQIVTAVPIQNLLRSERAPRVLFPLAGAAFLLSLHWTLTTIGHHSSRNQRGIAEWLQKQVDAQPPLEVYDPVGILPRTQANYWFLGPGQAQKNLIVMNLIDQVKPELVLYAPKLSFLEPLIGRELERDYSHDGTGLFVRTVHFYDPPSKLSALEVGRRLRDTFPRLAGDPRITWRVAMKVNDKLVLKRQATWASFQEGDLLVPPGVKLISIRPFDLDLPFSTDIFSEFAFDADF